MIDFAVVANEPTPYRTHLLRRFATELPGTRLHSLFTMPEGNTSAPWKNDMDAQVNPVFFASAKTRRPRGRNAVKLFRDIRDYLLEHQVKLVVLHGYSDLTRILLIRWADQQGLPLWVRGDSNIFDDTDKPMAKLWLKRRLLTWIGRHSSGYMGMGSASRAFFKMYCNVPHQTLLCPVEPDYSLWETLDEQLVAEVAAKHGLEPGRKRMLFSGRLVPVKRVDIVIEAFNQIAADRPEWDLVIVGDGELRSELEARVAPAVRDRVKWLGFCQSDELGPIYRSCHLMAHAAAKEPWGLVINEATAASLPILTTYGVGGAIELVRHRVNGFLVAPNDTADFTQAMRHATADGVCEQLSARCASVLADWRASANPVHAIEEALRLAGLTEPPA
ncbi:MAG: glycosyltransferase [Planctomycetota bacterium]